MSAPEPTPGYCASAQAWLLAWVCGDCPTAEVYQAVRTLRVVGVRPFRARWWSSLRDLQRIALHLGTELQRHTPGRWRPAAVARPALARLTTGPRSCELVGIDPEVGIDGAPGAWVGTEESDGAALYSLAEVERWAGPGARWTSLLEAQPRRA